MEETYEYIQQSGICAVATYPNSTKCESSKCPAAAHIRFVSFLVVRHDDGVVLGFIASLERSSQIYNSFPVVVA